MNRLKILRIEKGENLQKIAKYLNVTMQTVSNYENDQFLDGFGLGTYYSGSMSEGAFICGCR